MHFVELFSVKVADASCKNESTVHAAMTKNDASQPPTVICKMKTQLEYTLGIHIAHMFLHVWRRFVQYPQSLLVSKISASEQVGSLFRERCWLGSQYL